MEYFDNKIINLGDYLIGDRKVLVYRTHGKVIKDTIHINTMTEQCKKITVIVPSHLYSANASFLQGLFEDVIKKLGEKAFYKKFVFECQGSYKIEADIQETVDRVLREAGMK